jgi:hypothetical protein
VGRFSVEFEVANSGDLTLMERGLLPPDQVRRETIRGVVDSGAAELVLPQAVVERLGLPLGNQIRVCNPTAAAAGAERPKGSSSRSWDAIAPSRPSANRHGRRPSWARSCSKTSACS